MKHLSPLHVMGIKENLYKLNSHNVKRRGEFTK